MSANMSSGQQQHSVDLIEFSDKSDNVGVLNKPQSDIVQQMVMSETTSASLIATAVAKLTTSTVISAINKSESKSATESPSSDQQQQQPDNVTVATAADQNASVTTVVSPNTPPSAAPRKTIIKINSTQVCMACTNLVLPNKLFICSNLRITNNKES